MMRLTVLAMNIVHYPLLIIWTVLSLSLAFPFIYLCRLVTGWEMERAARMFIWGYGRVWMELLRPFARVRKKGLQPQNVPTPCVFVANHLSFFDVYCMGTLPVTNFSIVVRAWPFKMWFYAPFMKAAKYLNSESLGQDVFMDGCREVLEKGGSILFFPEGHRSKDGTLGRFYSGAFKVAVENNVPVVPLVISGTEKLLPAGEWKLNPANVLVEGLEPVYPEAFVNEELPHLAMRKHVKQAIAAARTAQ